MDLRKLWGTVLGELETDQDISRAQFKTWFKGTAILSFENGEVLVAVPNIMARKWLREKYQSKIQDSLQRVVGSDIATIDYKVTLAAKPKDPLVNAVVGQAAAETTLTPAQLFEQSAKPQAAPVTVAMGTSARKQPPTSLNPRYTFDNFVVGDSNELAHAASQAVVRFPGEKYNPLFIYGGVGLGKTHLLQSIGNLILQQDPSKRVRYVTSEQFTSEFITAVQTKKSKSFAEAYRSLDVLIVDDIQFLGNKEKTQEEFFHTFNTLQQQNKQIILSSDRAPKTIPNLEDRLRSRFESGMSADVQRPELETRAAIIQSKALTAGTSLSVELVEYLARHYQHSVRELEGALTKLLAYCELRDMDPSLELAQGIIGQPGGARRRTVTAKKILEKTAEHFDVQTTDLTGPRRDKNIVLPRQIAMYVMRKELGLSYPQIAGHVGKRDHTTAMHSVNKIEKLVELDSELRHEISGVRERITA